MVEDEGFTLPACSGGPADGAQESPPALPFRYPRNFIRECVGYIGPLLPIRMRENIGFVTQTHAVLVTLWHRFRLLNCHSRFCAHRHSLSLFVGWRSSFFTGSLKLMPTTHNPRWSGLCASYWGDLCPLNRDASGPLFDASGPLFG